LLWRVNKHSSQDPGEGWFACALARIVGVDITQGERNIMETLNSLYNLMGLIFVLGTIISMGLSLTMAQITRPFVNYVDYYDPAVP
jgi:hypothetical protein